MYTVMIDVDQIEIKDKSTSCVIHLKGNNTDNNDLVECLHALYKIILN